MNTGKWAGIHQVTFQEGSIFIFFYTCRSILQALESGVWSLGSCWLSDVNSVPACHGGNTFRIKKANLCIWHLHIFFLLSPQGLCSTCLFSLLLALTQQKGNMLSFFWYSQGKKSPSLEIKDNYSVRIAQWSKIATNCVPLHSLNPADSTSLVTLDFNPICLSSLYQYLIIIPTSIIVYILASKLVLLLQDLPLSNTFLPSDENNTFN